MSRLDPLDIQGQEQSQAKAKDRARRAEQVQAEDIEWIMSEPRGRRFVRGLMERAGVYRLSFNTNALMMAFHEGQRNEALALLDLIIAHCPDRYAEMLKEGKETE